MDKDSSKKHEKKSGTKGEKSKNSSHKSQKNDPKANFLKRINLAKITYDYADEQKDAKAKSERLEAINDLLQLLNDQRMVTQLFIPNIETVMYI